MNRRGSVAFVLGIALALGWVTGASLSAGLPVQWTQAQAADWMRGTFDGTTLQGDAVSLAQRLQLDWDQRLAQFQGPARALALDAEGNLLIAGYVQQGSGEFSHVLKCTPDGRVLWDRTQGNGRASRALGLATDPAGNAYVAGYTWISGNDFLLYKYDPDGHLLWQRQFSGGGDDRAQAVAADGRGRVVVTGVSTLRDADVLTLLYDANGNALWQRRYDGRAGDWAYDVALDERGNAYVVGTTLVAGQKDLLLLKYDATGRLLWSRSFDAGGEEVAQAVALNGQVAVAGYSERGGRVDFLVAAFDTEGRLNWSRTEDASARDLAYGASWDPRGHVLVAGSSLDRGRERFHTLKLDGRGNLVWSRPEAAPGSGRGYAVRADAQGRVFVTGMHDNGYRTLRYRDGFLPEGAFATQPHRFRKRVDFQSLVVEADLHGQALTAVVESSDSDFQTMVDRVELPIRPNQQRYPLQGLQAARAVRVRFEFDSAVAWQSPVVHRFTLHATSR